MNRIDELFKRKGKNILSVYFTAGFPKKENLVEQILLLEKSGVDMIEIGLPYSDPLADGPVIQESSQQALLNGMNTDYLFNSLKNIRSLTNIPLIIMGYYNCFLQYGENKFLNQCKQIGIDGLILPDLPPEIFEIKYKEDFIAKNIHLSFLITPQCSEERIKYLDNLSGGFLYAITQASTTGNSKNFGEHSLKYFKKIKTLKLKNPVLGGFGISNNEKFHIVSSYLNGGIIGSAYIQLCSKNPDEKTTINFIQEIIKIKNHAYSN